MKKFMVFSSEFDSENGQAVVTRRVVQQVLPGIRDAETCIYAAGCRPRSILSWIMASIKLWRVLTISGSGTIYVVCSRTIPGFIRDLPALVLALLGNRVVVHCHGSDFFDLLTQNRLSRLVRYFYRRCEVIVPCRHLKDRVESFVLKVHVCENFFNDAVPLKTDPVETDALSARLIVVWNSNIMASKGFFDVAGAIDILARAGHSITFVCFGKVLGDEEKSASDVEQELSRYMNCPWFNYLGLVEHSRAVAALQNCDVVALPSRYRSEMQPLAIIEAMCAAKRIVVSDNPNLRVTVGGYPADFIPANDISAVTECLEKLCKEKHENSNQFITKNFAAAKDAKTRFSAARFDVEMADILL